MAKAGDPTREGSLSVPSRDPREAVAWLRAAVVDDKVSPEEEQRVNAQGQRSEVGSGQRPGPPRSILCCWLCWGRWEHPAPTPGEGKVGSSAAEDAHRSTLQEVEASIRYSPADTDSFKHMVLSAEKTIE